MSQCPRRSARIARLGAKQGAHSSVGNQAVGVSKASGTPSCVDMVNASQSPYSSDASSFSVTTNSKRNKARQNRKSWTREEYYHVMWCYYYCMFDPSINTGIVQATYDLWVSKFPSERPAASFTANNLATTRRFIVNKKKLSDVELDSIKNDVKKCLTLETQVDESVESVSPLSPDGQETVVLLSPTAPLSTAVAAFTASDNQLYQDLVTIWEEIKCIPRANRKRLPRFKLSADRKKVINEVNLCVFQLLHEFQLEICELNSLVYAAAVLVYRTCHYSINFTAPSLVKTNSQERESISLHVKLQSEINKIRGDLSIVIEVMNGNASSRVAAKFRSLKRRYNLSDSAELAEIKCDLTMMLKCKVQKLRRAKRRHNQSYQNHLFSVDAKKFFRELRGSDQVISSPPSLDHTLQFWKNIWGKSDPFNAEAGWLHRERLAQSGTPQMAWSPLTEEEITAAIKKLGNWKAPGLDCVPNFWLKYFPAIHSQLLNCFNNLIDGAVTVPQWLVTGSTRLIPKNGDISDPKNYRPITCLPTMYKVLTAVLSDRLYLHFDQNGLFAPEQRGCRRSCYGCRDLLLIDKFLVGDCRKFKKNMSTAFIDYCKAYDSVPHSWISESLNLYKVAPQCVSFLNRCMELWATQLFFVGSTGRMEVGRISIDCGIFQGDSLSPLLFCIALIPLSNELRVSNTGYHPSCSADNINITHSFYMDDLKCYAKGEQELSTQLHIIQQFSADINMRIGISKCAKAAFHAGKLVSSEGFPLTDSDVIADISVEGYYKYLGLDQCECLLHAKMKVKIEKEYLHRCRLVMSSELSSKNKMKALNMFAVPVIRYGFGILDWTQTELSKLDVATRKAMRAAGMHHPTADVDRVYVRRADGGRGLLNILNVWKSTIVSLATYLTCVSSYDVFLQGVCDYQYGLCQSKSIFSLAKKFEREFSIVISPSNNTAIVEARKAGLLLKNAAHSVLLEKWQQKPLHGKFVERLGVAFVDKQRSLQWMNSSGLKGTTEGFLCAAQDQALKTRLYAKQILHEDVDGSCRLCHHCDETLDHLLSSCEVLAKTEYITRHNNVARYVHWCLCRAFDIECAKAWWNHCPINVVDTERCLIMWDKAVITDMPVAANRPDIVVTDKSCKHTVLIDVSCPCDSNIALKEAEKLTKYRLLQDEIHRMWGTTVDIIPIIIGALGLVKQGQVEILKKLPKGTHCSFTEIQKTAILGSLAIIRKVLSL